MTSIPCRAVRFAGVALLTLAGCDYAYPEVVVVNRTSPQLLLRDVSFNGCLWTGELAYGEATSPQKCLPGPDRVHFKKLDLAKQSVEPESVWYSYQTVTEHAVGYGDDQKLELTVGDMEQDFAVAGPFGH